MAHRRGSFRGRGISDSQRRKKLWSAFQGPAVNESSLGDPTITLNFELAAGPVLTSPQSQSFAHVFVAANDAGAIDPESTLMCLRGSLQLQKNAVGVGNIQTFAFGIGVLEAGAALLGAFPNPATPEGANWDGWMFYRSQAQGALDANAGQVDAKAMRKIQSGYALIMVMGSHEATFIAGSVSQAPAIAGFFTSRGLFLLP